MLDCFTRTKRLWGGFDKYSMVSVLICADIEFPERWIGHRLKGPNLEELIESIRNYSHDHLALMVPSFEKADLCDQETHALFALLICDSELHSDLSERLSPFLEEIRREIFDELHCFYTENMRMSDYSTRLGSLMTICHTLREGNVLFKEFFRMQVKIFDLYVAQTMMHEL
ncbi:hypothetical protein PENTCL1PPCAC_16434, partial [Pristionchus entomophagus]